MAPIPDEQLPRGDREEPRATTKEARMAYQIPTERIKDAHVYYQKVGSLEKTAKEYGITAITLSRRFKRLGLPLNKPGIPRGTKRRKSSEMPSVVVDRVKWVVAFSGGSLDGERYPVQDHIIDGKRTVGIDLGEGRQDIYEFAEKDGAKKIAKAIWKETIG